MRLQLFKKTEAQTDEALMQRVSSGDGRAFDVLYRRHARRVMGFFFRQLRHDEALAADNMQETFMRVWSHRERWKAGGEFLPWLFSIAYNICKNEYRREGYHADYERECLVRREAEEAEAEIRLDRSALDEALRETLERMPGEARALFALRYEEEMTVPQIASVMGIAEGTVKSRLHTMTNILKQTLKEYE